MPPAASLWKMSTWCSGSSAYMPGTSGPSTAHTSSVAFVPKVVFLILGPATQPATIWSLRKMTAAVVNSPSRRTPRRPRHYLMQLFLPKTTSLPSCCSSSNLMLTFCPSSPPVVLQRVARRTLERETLARHYWVVREVLRAAHGRRAAADDEDRAPRTWTPLESRRPPIVVVVLVMLPDAAREATLPGARAVVTGVVVGLHPRVAACRGAVRQIVDRLRPALALQVAPLAAVSLEVAGRLLPLRWVPLALPRVCVLCWFSFFPTKPTSIGTGPDRSIAWR